MAIEFTQDTLDEIYAFAVALGRRAGDLLLERIDKQIASDGETAYTYTEKDNAVDIVTQTDEGNPIDTSTPSTKERKKVAKLRYTWRHLSKPQSRRDTPSTSPSSPATGKSEPLRDA